MIIAIDLDNTICTPINKSTNVNQVRSRKPLANVVKYIKKLKKKQHYIKIFTHRKFSLVMEKATIKWLKIHHIPYDELIFDKPKYDILIDDKAERFTDWESIYNKVLVEDYERE